MCKIISQQITLLLQLLLIIIIVSPSSINMSKILIFGGNGFIGSELVSTLLSTSTPKPEIYLVSRGNWPYDSSSRIKPHIKAHIECDRENSDLEYCTELVQLVSEHKFSIVYDFSGYRGSVVEESYDLVQNSTDLYVYISTDSVYEVSKSNGKGVNEESDAIRPEDEEERERLNEFDEYGNEKLEGEEVLIKKRAEGGCPYLIVRLPDVIGARDSTERLWTYILWIKYYDFIKVPIFVPKHVRSLKTSYAYVKDIVRALLHLIDKGIKDEVYNVGFKELYTLEEFLRVLADVMGKEIQFDYESPEQFNLFPSVSRGGLNVDKLLSTGFVPTNLKDALKESVEFYEKAFLEHKSERDDVVHQLTKYVLGRDRKGDFLKFIDKLSGDYVDHNEL